MFKNYLLLTLRNIARQKASSFIAIAGLALGLSSALLLYSYIDYHFSFEDFMPENSNVKRLVISRFINKDKRSYSGNWTISPYAADQLKENVSSIEEVIPFIEVGERLFHVDDTLNREKFFAVSISFFEIIPLPLIEGDRDNLLLEPNSIVVNKMFAQKYFHGESALGKGIIFHDDEDHNLSITGVVDTPRNTHLHSDEAKVFFSDKFYFQSLNEFDKNPGSDKRITIYFKPVGNYDNKVLENEISNFTNTIPPTEEYERELYYEDFEDIHLFSRVNDTDANNPLYIILFLGLLTIVLLVISITNIVLILTAQSINRTKEVGVRLVMGGRRKDLIIQFLTESIIFSFISLIIALVLKELFQPAFSNLVQIDLEYSYTPVSIAFTVILTLFVGFLSGIFPAFYLSSLKSVESLKGNKLLKLGISKKILIIVQFLFTSIVLICTLTINNELKFIQNIDIGFDSNNLISVFPGKWGFDVASYDKLIQLRDELIKIDGIEDVTYTSWVPMLGGSIENNTFLYGDGVTSYQEYFTYIDKNYINALGIDLLEGEVKVNTIIAMKGITDYRNLVIGDIVELNEENYMVGSIIDDYYLQSALNGHKNFFHIVSDNLFKYQIIKTSKDVDLKKIKSTWKSIFPEFYKVEFNYLRNAVYDENFPQIVFTIIKVINITMIFTLFISTLGLFGLTLQAVKQKTKEIGVRKVLGAGVFNIILQFLKEFVSLILIAVLIGIPTGLYIVKKGLITLGYGMPLHNLPRISIVSAVTIISIGVLLVVSMVIKAALSNPSTALRYE